MSAYANVGITYLNKKGVKRKAPAGSVFHDYNEEEFADWEERGWARKATAGEKAEAAEAEQGAEKAAKTAGRSTKAAPKADAKKTNNGEGGTGDDLA